MSKYPVLVKLLHDSAKLPKYAKAGDAGADLYSVQDVTILPMESAIIDTGIAIELPQGHEAQIRSRSGLAAKCRVFVLNSPGTIDEGYRDSIKVILYNLGSNTMEIKVGDRIAQMVIKEVEQFKFVTVSSLSSSERGTGGLGHTGAN